MPRIVAVLLALAGAASASAIELELDVALVPASPHAPQLPPDLVIGATWPDACLPAVERMSTTPGHIDLHLGTTAKRCLPAPTPLELRVNPARAAGWEQLPLGAYEVRLFVRHDGQAEELIAFHWLDARGEAGQAKPENGFWRSVGDTGHAPALSGGGITIERQEQRIAVTLLGYEAGNPMWYFGSTLLRDSTARVHLMRMLGGSGLFEGLPAAPVAESGPVLHLMFEAPARAKAWIERPLAGSDQAIELQGLSLRRLAFASGHAADSWRGRWLLVPGNADVARIIGLTSERTSDADSFTLLDERSNVSLDCRLGEAEGQSMPAFCALREAGTELATFDRIGLDRMTGQTRDGERVEFVRVPD